MQFLSYLKPAATFKHCFQIGKEFWGVSTFKRVFNPSYIIKDGSWVSCIMTPRVLSCRPGSWALSSKSREFSSVTFAASSACAGGSWKVDVIVNVVSICKYNIPYSTPFNNYCWIGRDHPIRLVNLVMTVPWPSPSAAVAAAAAAAVAVPPRHRASLWDVPGGQRKTTFSANNPSIHRPISISRIPLEQSEVKRSPSSFPHQGRQLPEATDSFRDPKMSQHFGSPTYMLRIGHLAGFWSP